MAVKQGARQDLFEYSRRGDVVLLNTWLNNNKGHHHKRSMLSLFRPTVSSSPGWLCALKDTGNGYTALHQAALHGQVEICRELISADVQLIEARDRRGCLPLHLAAWNGHVAVVQQLLFTLPDCHSPIVDAVNNAKESALHLAVKHGHTNVVTLLLQKRCNVQLRNCKGENALDIAARLGQAQICRLLIGHRPELICQSAVESFSTPSSHNDNINVDVSIHPICVYPLHLAARHGHVDVISILANAGFQLDFVTEEGSALHLAAVYGKVNAVCLLLEYDISCEIRDSHGRTVLQLLAEHEQNKASDLTQLMQARDCWAECRRIIQAHVDKKNKAFMCGESSGRNDDHVYCNVPIISSKTTNITAISGDVIWRPKDVSPSSKDQGHRHHSTTNCSSIIYHPISIQADLVNLGNVHDDMTISSISTLSLATTLTPRDTPSTSPMICRTTRPVHSPIDSLPLLDNNHLNLDPISINLNLDPTSINLNRVQRSPCQLRGDEEQLTHQSCSYQAPLAYDTWTPPALKYDNLCTKNIVHPHKAYDNVPANLLVYDNSPSPGHRRWDHVCSSPSPGHRRWDHVCSSTTSPCYASSPIPPAKPPRMRMPVLSAPIEEGSISPASTIIYNPVLDSVIETIQLKENGSAPLAVAEEIGIGVSNSTSIVSSLNSPTIQRPSLIVAKEEQISQDDQRELFSG